MRTLLTTATAALLGAALLQGGQDPSNGIAKQIAEAGKMFRARCMNCHQPPDPDFAIDRAWLGQVKDTA